MRRGEQVAARAAYAAGRVADTADQQAGEGVAALQGAAAEAMEAGRAVLLSSSLDATEVELARLARSGHGELADRWRTAAADVAALTRAELAAEQPLTMRGATDTAATTAARADATERRRRAREAISQLDGFADFDQPPSVERLRSIAGRTPLVYLAATELGGVAVAVDRGGVRTRILPELRIADVATQVDTFVAAADDPHPHRVEQVLSWAWRAVMQPVVDLLDGARAVTLVPTGQLGLLPLHAAGTRLPRPADGWRQVLDTTTVSYAIHARARDHAVALARSRRAAPALAVIDPQGNLGAVTPVELDALTSAFPGPDHMLPPLVGPRALTCAVLPALRTAGTAMFVCHAGLDADRPLDGGLELAEGQVLSVRTLATSELDSTRLMILTACESARYDRQHMPDEVVGLPAALFQAEVAGVLATLWRIRGAGPAAVVAKFLELWRAGTGSDPATALRAAQLWVRDAPNGEKARDLGRYPEFAEPRGKSADELQRWRTRNDLQHPINWAAFTLTGA